jgi:uncharacterized membrane protein
MSFAPLFAATPVVQIHAFAALAAFVLGAVQLLAPKGTIPHRAVGWTWVVLMALIAVSSFWIPIHLLSIFTLAMLPLAVLHARRHRVERHRKAMTSIFLGAMVIAGLFTLLPGRIMHDVVFGP